MQKISTIILTLRCDLIVEYAHASRILDINITARPADSPWTLPAKLMWEMVNSDNSSVDRESNKLIWLTMVLIPLSPLPHLFTKLL